MKKILHITAMFASLLIPVVAGAQTEFDKQYRGTDEFKSGSVVQTSDDGYAFTASDGTWYMNTMKITRTDKYGNQLWVKSYGKCSNQNIGLAYTSDNGFITCYEVMGLGQDSARIIRTDQDGNVIFKTDYQCQETETHMGYIIQCPDNSFLACGIVGVLASASLLLKIDPSGNILWEKTFRYGTGEMGTTIALSNDNGIIMTSQSFMGPSVYRKLTADGDVIWEKYNYTIEPTEVINVPEGYVCSAIKWDTVSNFCLYRMDENGDSVWMKTYPVEGNASSLAMTYDNGYFIVGSVYDKPVPGHNQIIILRTDADGDLLWTRNYGGGAIDFGSMIKATTDTGFIITGQTSQLGNDSINVRLIKGKDDNTETGVVAVCSKRDPVIFPNPSSGKIYVESVPGEDLKISVSGITGNIFYENYATATGNLVTFDVPVKSAGMCFVKVSSGTKTTIRKVIFTE